MKNSREVLILTGAICQKLGIAIFAVLLSLAAFPLVSDAQITTATILGTITDPSGQAVPSASVTARNTETGLKRTVTSDEEGNYRIEFLPIGNYVVEVTAGSGFKRAIREGIVLRVSDLARTDISLEVGSVNEQVTVTTTPPEVNTTSAELGR